MNRKIRIMMVVTSREGQGLKHIYKEYESEMIPMAGMKLEDCGLKEPVEIISVTCNIENNIYYIDLPVIEMETKESCDSYVESMKHHDWKEN